jgi:hypothetical protein
MIHKIDIDKVNEYLIDPIDLFICSSSYEERCKTFAYSIDSKKIKSALIFENEDLFEYVHNNSELVVSLFEDRGSIVGGSTKDPLLTADRLRNALDKVSKSCDMKTVVIDITTFTHESLLILIGILQLIPIGKELIIVYTSAAEYSIGDEVEYKWLSRGVDEVRTVLGFPGNVLSSRKTHLIILVGYEHERASKLIEIIEPNTIALGYGRSGSSTTDKDRDANQHYHKLVENMAASYGEVMNFEIYCDDPYRTQNAILEQTKTVGSKNIVLAPMNNKITTIGAALAAIKYRDIQICYAPALQYNYHYYSTPGKTCYLLNMGEELYKK